MVCLIKRDVIKKSDVVQRQRIDPLRTKNIDLKI